MTYSIDKEISSIKSTLGDLNIKLAKLEMEKKKLAVLAPEYRLASTLHDTQCHFNHTDGCGWFYEIDNGAHQWVRSEHAKWLKRAKKLVLKCETIGLDPNDAVKIAGLINSL